MTHRHDVMHESSTSLPAASGRLSVPPLGSRRRPARVEPRSALHNDVRGDGHGTWERRPGSMATRLQDQWEDLVHSPNAVEHARTWWDPALVDRRSITSLDDVLALVGFQGAREDVCADARLLHLVCVAAHDELATRVVLQRILPGLLAISSRRGRRPGTNGAEVFSEIAATAWALIRTYPVARRPGKVAANLLRDVEYETFVRRQRMRSTRDETCVERPPEPNRSGDTHVLDQLVEVLREARDAGMAAHDVRFLAELASGRHPDDLGIALGCSPRTIRTRRRVLTQVLHRFMNGDDVSWPTASPRFYAAWSRASDGERDAGAVSDRGGSVAVADCS